MSGTFYVLLPSEPAPLLLMSFRFLPKLWQPSASTHFWSFLDSATCGSDKVRQGIKSHHSGVTRGAAWRNFPGIGCARLDCCSAARGSHRGRQSPVFIATASSGASAGATAWGGVGREREGGQVAAEIRGCCRFPPSHSLCSHRSCEDLFGLIIPFAQDEILTLMGCGAAPSPGPGGAHTELLCFLLSPSLGWECPRLCLVLGKGSILSHSSAVLVLGAVPLAHPGVIPCIPGLWMLSQPGT